MEAFLPIILAAVGVLLVIALIYAIVSEARDSGWFRAVTYPTSVLLVVWAIYDHVREYGARQTFVGFSKQEFEERFGRGSSPASAGVAD